MMTETLLPKMDKDAWTVRATDETGFWGHWIRTRGGKWPEDFQRRVDPAAPLLDAVRDLLDDLDLPGDTPAEILDIGSGPLSILGYQCETRDVRLTLVDPLANQYNALLDEAGVAGVPRPVEGYFETALETMGQERFDVVWCRNALDHSMDPLLGLYNLLSLCRIGGGLILSFHPDEADCGSYQGLHQWNLRLQDNRVLLTQMQRELDLTPLLEAQEVVEIHQEGGGRAQKGMVTITLKKRIAPNLSQAMLGASTPG